MNIDKNEQGERTFSLNSRGGQILNTHLKFEAFKEKIGKDAVEYERGHRKSIRDNIDFDDLLSGGGYKELKEARMATSYVYSNVAMRNKILEEANDEAQKIREDALKYAIDVINKLEGFIEKAGATIQQSREELENEIGNK